MSSSNDCNGIHLDTWHEVRSYLLEHSGQPRYWRGVSNAEWCLTTSLDRFASENYLNDRNALRGRLLQLYRQYSSQLGDPSGSYSDIELWALGQHWGLPTTYLDWSQSPMIAAFFAMTGVDSSKPADERNGCIYGLEKTDGLLRAGDITIIEPDMTPRNVRMTAQRGLFTETREGTCLIDALGRLELADCISAITFPMTARSDALRELALMTIDDLSIYPDRVGVIRHVRSTAMRGA